MSPTIYVLNRNISEFLSENFQFLVVKLSIYLNRRGISLKHTYPYNGQGFWKVQPKWGECWIFTSGIQHKKLIKHSLLENESRFIILYNQALPIFYTHKRSWRRGHSRKMYAHGDVFFFFFDFIPHFFLLSLSFSPFCLFLRISYAGPFELLLIGVDGTALQRYNGKPNIFGLKIWQFFLASEAFRALFLPATELVLILLSPPTYCHIKWYWNWKIACINFTVRVVQKMLDSNYT